MERVITREEIEHTRKDWVIAELASLISTNLTMTALQTSNLGSNRFCRGSEKLHFALQFINTTIIIF